MTTNGFFFLLTTVHAQRLLGEALSYIFGTLGQFARNLQPNCL